MSKSASRLRRVKVAEETKPTIKDKFLRDAREIETMQQTTVPKFVPATQNQKLAVGMLRGGVRMMFLQGSPGTGKSMLAAWWAATLLKEKKVENIYLIRANVSCGKSGGSLPGSEEEKLAPFFVQTMAHLTKFLGAGYLDYCINKGVIKTKSTEFMRGMSLENACVLVEEAQGLTESDLEMVITRLGAGSTYLLTGDNRQNDLRGASGLGKTIALINKMVEDEPDYLTDEDINNIEGLIGGVEFTPDDCVRDPLTKALVKMYYYKQ